MIDWELVAKIAGGGFGIVILVLAILSVVLWLVNLLARRFAEKGKESETKERKA
jgi:Na+-transporting methylmalonyl-CoA/oxaloacetate decarboxylase gamma subunit